MKTINQYINESLVDLDLLQTYFYRTLESLQLNGDTNYNKNNVIDFLYIINETIDVVPSRYQKLIAGYPNNNRIEIENAIENAIEMLNKQF